MMLVASVLFSFEKKMSSLAGFYCNNLNVKYIVMLLNNSFVCTVDFDFSVKSVFADIIECLQNYPSTPKKQCPQLYKGFIGSNIIIKNGLNIICSICFICSICSYKLYWGTIIACSLPISLQQLRQRLLLKWL